MRIAKILAIITLITILTISIVAVATAQESAWSLPYKRDTGSAERKRAIAFGEDFTKPYAWAGIKYRTVGNQGLKGSTSVKSNLPYNEYIKYARNPGHISNFDPRMRGYTIMNEYFDMIPVELPYYMNAGQKLLPQPPSGAVRITSTRDSKGQQRSYMPRSTVQLRVGYLPELNSYEVYEAWLVDEDTDYVLSLGRVIPPGAGQLSTLNFEVANDLFNYDYAMVTIERFPEFRQRGPLGDVVLVGSIPQVRKDTNAVSATSYYEKEYWPGK
ncbi:hypothetical protein KY333_01520 [Candidatus Woesearchaeota archaeon]|nr:hypothetical protein [Candidatus Woesearchaeota archaeon]MBW2994595.1 hypothetical protein [Candidatus Woesearchaeota archaeon]